MEAVLKAIKLPHRIDSRLTRAEIAERIARIEAVLPCVRKRLNPCTLCPRRCGAWRSRGGFGECGLGDGLRVAAVSRHRGEEPPISGKTGAINVFFSGCNLHCIYCQNWPISQRHVGQSLSPAELADRIMKRWHFGAQSLGWVTPTPQVVQALETYRLCLLNGCDLPLVYNCGGYEDAEIIQLLSGVVDIWLPDAKTADSGRAAVLQGVGDYPQRNMRAISAMMEQLHAGQARAVIVRHLVLPEGIQDSRRILRILRRRFGDRIYISLMVQYFPAHKAIGHESLGRKLREEEYENILEFAKYLGFKKGWVQHYGTETGISPHCLS